MTPPTPPQPSSQEPQRGPGDPLARLHLERLRLRALRELHWRRETWGGPPDEGDRDLVVSDPEALRVLDPATADEERAFRREHGPAAEAGDRLEALCERIPKVRERVGETSGLERLRRRLDLSAFERDLLVLCLAPEIDPGILRVLAFLHDDVSRQHPTPHLAERLLAEPGRRAGEASRALAPDAPLVRCRLVEKGRPPFEGAPDALCPLRLRDRARRWILDGGFETPDLPAGHARIPPAPLTGDHERVVDELARSPEPDRVPAVNLVGEPGTGRRALAVALADALGLTAHEVPAQALAGDDADLGDLEREAAVLGLLVYADLAEAGPARGRRLARRLSGRRLPAVVASRTGLRPLDAWTHVEVPRPDGADQRDLWRQALGPAAGELGSAIDDLVERVQLGPHGIAEAARAARKQAAQRAGDSGVGPTAGDLSRACRRRANPELGDLATRLTPNSTWDDIVLPSDTLAQLRELADHVAHRGRVHGSWGFRDRLSRGRGIAAMFAGPSGTGKTMAAEVLAGHLEMDLYRVDLASVVSKYIGETEKNLRRLFRAAEGSKTLLFFDEADALFARRTEVRDAHDRHANVEVDQLLQLMEGHSGLTVLATNRRGDVDRAFLRRLRFLVEFPFPDVGLRKSIWQRVFPSQAPLDDLDYDRLARLEVPGGNIRNIAVNAAFLAARGDEEIGMDHVLHAARREYDKIDKHLDPGAFQGRDGEVTPPVR